MGLPRQVSFNSFKNESLRIRTDGRTLEIRAKTLLLARVFTDRNPQASKSMTCVQNTCRLRDMYMTYCSRPWPTSPRILDFYRSALASSRVYESRLVELITNTYIVVLRSSSFYKRVLVNCMCNYVKVLMLLIIFRLLCISRLCAHCYIITVIGLCTITCILLCVIVLKQKNNIII